MPLRNSLDWECRSAAAARIHALRLRIATVMVAAILIFAMYSLMSDPPRYRGGNLSTPDALRIAVCAAMAVVVLVVAVLWRRAERLALAAIDNLRELSSIESAALRQIPRAVLTYPCRAGVQVGSKVYFVLLSAFAIAVIAVTSRLYLLLLGSLGAIYLASWLHARWLDAIRLALAMGPDYACLQCGYLREGLSRERDCPECGTPRSAARFWYIKLYWGEERR